MPRCERRLVDARERASDDGPGRYITRRQICRPLHGALLLDAPVRGLLDLRGHRREGLANLFEGLPILSPARPRLLQARTLSPQLGGEPLRVRARGVALPGAGGELGREGVALLR